MIAEIAYGDSESYTLIVDVWDGTELAWSSLGEPGVRFQDSDADILAAARESVVGAGMRFTDGWELVGDREVVPLPRRRRVVWQAPVELDGGE